jgi:hypothetical protein
MEDNNATNNKKMRIIRAGELLREFGSSDRDFYRLLNKVNEQLICEGLKPLSEDGFIDVIESIGWGI